MIAPVPVHRFPFTFCNFNILSICSPHNDIVYEMAVFRSGMHSGCFVSVW